MARNKPVVSAHRAPQGVDSQKASAWRRVSGVLAFAVAIVGGARFFVDGGLPASHATAVGLGLGLLTYLIMGVIGAARGHGSITAVRDPKNRFRFALALGAFVAVLGGSGVYFHDGGPLTEALATAAVLGVVGFAAAFFPVLASILSIFGLSM